MPGPPTEAARALWARVQERWDDDAVHRSFIEHCAASEQLPFAAQCYREHAAAAPAEAAPAVGEDVERRLAAIRAKAMAALTLQPRPAEPRRGCRLALSLVALAMLLTVVWLLATLLR